jgi:hypothetical protein
MQGHEVIEGHEVIQWHEVIRITRLGGRSGSRSSSGGQEVINRHEKLCPVLILGHEVVWGQDHEVIHGPKGHRFSRGHS